MFTYGTQVNPSLLRQDFSPILQAAQAQAQATQQAAAIRAQTLANIGSTIGNAIQTYTKKQEEKKKREAAVSTIGAIFENNPELAAGLKVPMDASGKPIRGAIDAVINTFESPADALKIASTLEELGVTRKARQQQADAARYASMFTPEGTLMSPYRSDAGAGLSPEARAMGQQMVTQRAQALANLGKTQAETKALQAKPAGTPKLETYETSERGYPEKVTIEIAPNGVRRELGRVATNVPEGMKRLPTGGLAPEAGSKQEAEKNAKDAAFQQSYDTGLEQARVMLNAMENAGKIITQPALSYQGFGSTMLGWTPTAASLNGYYQTINSNQALNTIRNARKESPSGGNPYGQLAVKEFESAASLQGTFNRELEDKVAIDNMNQVAGILYKAYPQLKDEYETRLQSAFSEPPKPSARANPMLPNGWSFR